MSLLAFGGEMGFFVPSTSEVVENTTAGRFDASFARCAMKCHSSSAYADSLSVGAQTELWVHGECEESVVSGASGTFLQLLDGSDVAQVRLTHNDGTNILSLDYFDGTAWNSVGTIELTLNGTRQTLDLHAIVNSGTGTLALYVAGTLRIFDAAVPLAGITSLRKVRGLGTSVGTSRDYHWSQVIIANETTIGLKLGTIVMTGQGSTHTFTSGGFANIDETVYSDADEIHSDTAAQVELFTGTPVPSFTNYTIRAIGVYARAKKSGSGPAQMQLALRSAGTTYFSATKALDFGYGAFGNVWETNPATSAAFLSSEIAALEYGVKSIT